MINDSFSWLNKGSLTVITGPMFAGKTDELIRILNVFKYAGKNILVFQPLQTVRTKKKDVIVAHNQKFFPAQFVKDTSAILAKVKDFEKFQKLDVIGFDEVQFLELNLFPHIQNWVKAGKIVICAGLDKDYYNEYFGLMSKLLVASDFVKKLLSICSICQDFATHTQRLAANKPVNCYFPRIVVGSQNKYQARCSRCYVMFSNQK